jgi:hypothetical protein
MSWLQQNKFTVIFGGVTVLLAGVVGFMVIGAKGEYEKKKTEFDSKLSELQRLREGKPFPNDKNVKAYKAELAKVEGEFAKLHQQLLATELPLEVVQPNQFQDRLKQTIDRIKEESKTKNMLLPGQKKDDASAVAVDAGFNLGFDYLDKLPTDEASSELARDLKVIEFVTQQLLEKGATQLIELKREKLALESTEKAAENKKDAKKTGGAKNKSEEEVKLVSTHKFEVKFEAHQSSLMKILNAITQAKQPFIIPRRIVVRNEKLEGPIKEIQVVAAPLVPSDTPADPAAPPQPTPSAPNAGAGKINWIVGEEKLLVDLELEMADFADLKVAVETKGKASK